MEFTKQSKDILFLAAPMMMGNILQQLYNTFDVWMVGRYCGYEEYAAVGTAGTAMNLFLFFITGICSGLTVMFAQLYGSEKKNEFRSLHFQMMFYGGIFSIFFSMMAIFSFPVIAKLLQIPDDIISYVRVYLNITCMGIIAIYFYNFFTAVLRSVGNTRIPFVILFVSTITNFILDYIFIGKLKIGITGAAWATVMAETLAALVSFVYIKRTLKDYMFRYHDIHFKANTVFIQSIRLAFVSGFQQSGLYLGKFFVQGAVNTVGTSAIVAYTTASRIEGFVNSLQESTVSAISILTAQNYGAGKQKKVNQCLKYGIVLLAVLGAVSQIFLFVMARPLSSFVMNTGSGIALNDSMKYLQIVSWFYVVCYLNGAFDGWYIGIGKPLLSFIGVVAQVMIRAIFSWLWIGELGLNAVSLSTGIGWVLLLLYFVICFIRMKRKTGDGL